MTKKPHMAKDLIARMRSLGLTLSTAESCTGGAISAAITSVAGASDVFLGGVVSYSNEAKENILGVSHEILLINGAGSHPTVRQMAEGACRVLHADCAVATSGIAGPGGGTPQKPVGTVWMAWKTPSGVTTELHHFPGSRAEVIAAATAKAITRLAELIS